MKTLRHYFILLFISIISSLLINCEKEDPRMVFLDDPSSELNASALKAAPADVADEITYLLGLIETIETMLEDGLLNKGNANALIVKVQNAIKSIEKENKSKAIGKMSSSVKKSASLNENGNDNSAKGQLKAFINQVDAMIKSGKIPIEEGELLIKTAENAIIAIEGSFIDPRDEQEYAAILIGDQLWMAENLRYLPYVNQTFNQSTSDPRYYVYGNNGNNLSIAVAMPNFTTYGVLYNWPAAMDASPDGWHLPSVAEWNELAEFISEDNGGYNNLDVLKWEDVGAHLKSTTGWEYGGNGTDDYGFNAKPAGTKWSGSVYYGAGEFFVFGTSDQNSYNESPYWATVACYHYVNAYFFLSGKGFSGGTSIRCLKN